MVYSHFLWTALLRQPPTSDLIAFVALTDSAETALEAVLTAAEVAILSQSLTWRQLLSGRGRWTWVSVGSGLVLTEFSLSIHQREN
jgi:hypothetical protein